jgi:hypothetical protein
VKNLRLWLPKNGYRQEVSIPAEDVETIILPAAEHEAGHIIAAYHLGARVLGIALGFMPEREQRGMFLLALYGSKDSPVKTQCIVKAAGPAADILFQGGLDEAGASGDLRDIELLTGRKSFDPYLEVAKDILARYSNEFRCITSALRLSLDIQERTLGVLPDNHIGVLLLDEAQLMECLRKSCGNPSGLDFGAFWRGLDRPDSGADPDAHAEAAAPAGEEPDATVPSFDWR